MAKAGLTAAAYNVRINVNSLPNPAAGDMYLAELKEMEARAGMAEERLVQVMKERGGVISK
jgi:formiminotetrahydrofolate cyclodeaminase